MLRSTSKWISFDCPDAHRLRFECLTKEFFFDFRLAENGSAETTREASTGGVGVHRQLTGRVGSPFGHAGEGVSLPIRKIKNRKK